MRRINGGWVFDPADEGKVLAAEQDEIVMLKIAAHTRACCFTGHTCGRGERCKRRCPSCHEDSMAVWNSKLWKLDRQGTEILKAGVPCVETKPDIDVAALVTAVTTAVVNMLIAAGYTFHNEG